MLVGLASAATRANAAIVTLASQVLLSRILGLEEYGVLSQAIAMYAIADALVVTRAGDVAVYVVAQATGKSCVQGVRFSDLFIMDVLCGFCGCIVLVLSAAILYVERSPVSDLVFILSIGLPLSAGYGYWRNVAFLKGSAGAFLFADAVLPWARAVGSALVALRWGPKGVAVSEIAYVVARGIVFYCVQRKISIREGELRAAITRRRERYRLLLGLSVSSVLRNFLASALAQADIIWAGLTLADREVGIYRLLKTLAGAAGIGAGAAWFGKRRSVVVAAPEAFPWTLVLRMSARIGVAVLMLAAVVGTIWGAVGEIILGANIQEESRWCLIVLLLASGIEVGVSAWSALAIAARGCWKAGALAGSVGLFAFGGCAVIMSELGLLGIASARLLAVTASGACTIKFLSYRIANARTQRAEKSVRLGQE